MPEPMTAERLAEIRERAEKATPGDWWAWDRGVGYHIAVSMELDQWDTPADLLPGGSRTDIGRLGDAEFIAHARQDVPALLAEVERINRVARTQSGMISELTSTCMAAEAERDRLRRELDAIRARAHDRSEELIRARDKVTPGDSKGLRGRFEFAAQELRTVAGMAAEAVEQ